MVKSVSIIHPLSLAAPPYCPSSLLKPYSTDEVTSLGKVSCCSKSSFPRWFSLTLENIVYHNVCDLGFNLQRRIPVKNITDMHPELWGPWWKLIIHSQLRCRSAGVQPYSCVVPFNQYMQMLCFAAQSCPYQSLSSFILALYRLCCLRNKVPPPIASVIQTLAMRQLLTLHFNRFLGHNSTNSARGKTAGC